MKDSPLPEVLLDLASKSVDQVWIGRRSPWNFPSVDLADSVNFRASPGHHQRYDQVWLAELDLGKLAPGQFELVLDESLRMLPESGKLIVRFTQTGSCSVIALKHFLARRYGLRVRVDHEQKSGDRFTIVFGVERSDVERYRRSDWAFAVLTQGQRLENLTAFFQSIRQFDPDRKHEILVCGPQLPAELGKYGLTYTQGNYRESLAEICAKKNDIAQQTDRTNLLIVHDRYRLREDFFDGFERYGYDFDFVTIPQWYECGAPFPGYCAMSADDLSWSKPLGCTNYQALLPTQYLNGGLIIAKTQTLRDVPFNSLLFWNQAEDVELARTLREHSIPPRINPHSSAVTMGITTEYTRSILPFHGTHLTRRGSGWLKQVARFKKHSSRLSLFLSRRQATASSQA